MTERDVPEQNSFNLLEWMASGLSTLAITVVSMFWYFWKDDRKRLKSLEEYVSNHAQHAITRPEVEVIVTKVKVEFKEDHRDILGALREHRDEIREDLKEMRQLMLAKYSGPDRRKNP